MKGERKGERKHEHEMKNDGVDDERRHEKCGLRKMNDEQNCGGVIVAAALADKEEGGQWAQI
jgi:hypothetical protein